MKYGWLSLKLARKEQVHGVIASNVPLASLAMLMTWCKLSRRPLLLWLQDFQAGLAAIASGKGGLIPHILGVLERTLIRRADHVVVIADEFADRVISLGVDAGRVTTIENWAPLDDLPVVSRDNPWAREHGLHDKFVFLYSGTLGVKHSPHLLLELAREFASESEVRVVAIGEGPGADWLARQPEPRPIQLPFQPHARLAEVLGTGDVLVTLLDPAAGAYSVPSKTLSYLCAGRAILGALPSENSAARVIANRAGAGIVVPPTDIVALRRAARGLMLDPTGRAAAGARGRRYAEQHFDRTIIADLIEGLL
jgi:glycosyltransferase involved in cell wall biosynthesis